MKPIPSVSVSWSIYKYFNLSIERKIDKSTKRNKLSLMYKMNQDCGCHEEKKCRRNMYRTIRKQCDLRELKKAINEAGLTDAIATLDPITVFGPNNCAFYEFQGGQTCGTLQEILLYHVVPQYLKVSDLENDTLYDTLRDGVEPGLKMQLRANVYKSPTFNDVVTINGTEIYQENIKASNGVLHKIEKVLCPPAGSLLDLALATPELSILVQAVQAADPIVSRFLSEFGSWTLFAPSNRAFEDLLRETGLTLSQVLALPCLTEILVYHILNYDVGTVFSAAVKCGYTDVPSELPEKTVTLKRCRDIKIKDELKRFSKVVKADNLATNGVAHIVDRVLLPFVPCPPQ